MALLSSSPRVGTGKDSLDDKSFGAKSQPATSGADIAARKLTSLARSATILSLERTNTMLSGKFNLRGQTDDLPQFVIPPFS